MISPRHALPWTVGRRRGTRLVVCVAEPGAAPVDTMCPDCSFPGFSFLIREGFRDSPGMLSFLMNL